MNQNQLDIPIQPVERPILCSPYEEPSAHWVYDTETGEASRMPDAATPATGTKPSAREQSNSKCVSFKRRSGTTCPW